MNHSAGEKAFNHLEPREKTKIRVCSKWNFYSQKCKTCQYELICAKDWRIDNWFPLKEETENQTDKAEINNLIMVNQVLL